MRETLAGMYRKFRSGEVDAPVSKDKLLEDVEFISRPSYTRFVGFLREEINRSQVEPGDVTSVNYQIGYLAGITRILNHLVQLEESTRGVKDE